MGRRHWRQPLEGRRPSRSPHCRRVSAAAAGRPGELAIHCAKLLHLQRLIAASQSLKACAHDAGLKPPPPLEPAAANGGAAASAPPPLVPPAARAPSLPSETATPEAIRDGIVDYLRKKPGSKGGWACKGWAWARTGGGS